AVRQRGRGHALRRARPQGQPGGRVAVLVRRGDRAGVRCPDPPRGRHACRGLPQLRDHGLRLLHRAPAGRLVPAPERRPRPRAVLLGLPAAGVLRPRLPGPRGRPEPVRFPPGRPSPPPPAGRPLTAAEPTAPRARTASAPCPAAVSPGLPAGPGRILASWSVTPLSARVTEGPARRRSPAVSGPADVPVSLPGPRALSPRGAPPCSSAHSGSTTSCR